MSNLLERAIIDAKALKEAALKNAEQLVVEKYQLEVKEAMDRLLEQDEEEALEEMYSTQSSLYPHGRGDFAAAGGVQAVEEDLDLQENFYEKYGYEPDEQSRNCHYKSLEPIWGDLKSWIKDIYNIDLKTNKSTIRY